MPKQIKQTSLLAGRQNCTSCYLLCSRTKNNMITLMIAQTKFISITCTNKDQLNLCFFVKHDCAMVNNGTNTVHVYLMFNQSTGFQTFWNGKPLFCSRVACGHP